MTYIQDALSAIHCGISVLPVISGDKRPDAPALKRAGFVDSEGGGEWTTLQGRLPTEVEVQTLFANGSTFATICGKVSGGLEVMDFDIPDKARSRTPPMWRDWCEIIKEHDGGLFKRLVIAETTSGGYHVFYRCAVVEGNAKLCMQASSKKCTIETRGEGGYVLAAPSPGYKFKRGDLTSIQIITEDERDLLLSTARFLNEVIEENKVHKSTNKAHQRPGDDYAARTSWDEILTSLGARPMGMRKGLITWQRPGKSGSGISASTGLGHDGQDLLFVFTSNWYPFEPSCLYTKFWSYVLTEGKGDANYAAQLLKTNGFGKDKPRSNEYGTPIEAPKPKTILDIPGLERFEEAEMPTFSIEYVVEPYFFLGQAALLVADSGTGKSTFLVSVVAGLSAGQKFNNLGRCEVVNSIYYIGDADYTKSYEQFYRTNGGKPGGVTWIKGARPLDGNFKEELRTLCRAFNARIVVIDPLFNFMAFKTRDSNDGLQSVDAFGVLADIAEELNICIVAAHHVGKGADKKSANEVHVGSVMLKARARGYLYARPNPDDKTMIVVTDEKGSFSVRKGPAFAYRRMGDRVDYLRNFENPFDKNARPCYKQDDAKNWILNHLSTSGWTNGNDLWLLAESEGLKKDTFNEARVSLKNEGAIWRDGAGQFTSWCIVSGQKPYNPWGEE